MLFGQSLGTAVGVSFERLYAFETQPVHLAGMLLVIPQPPVKHLEEQGSHSGNLSEHVEEDLADTISHNVKDDSDIPPHSFRYGLPTYPYHPASLFGT
ncbi:hypothetical protein CISG_10395 [Coccidioides immitis RMSCC 3703]|uniref:Uncharacterized protein n=1 Tax=Coccidioides immitis RMSCC 3703 TaxID=454286 RepID=A0A0J8QVP9_COCIT|nr:hypothetical protein CISG_10395 [Coccidioides immitis RMSCC 3703]